ncbi:PREDICTED: eukaryotic translation initiation factor 4G-like [Ipomoea nil]|uniref:eukaryotic translation initiation factor 4G-like n=1 Tax=Ipomoea nil TaxID=35883 RepID=UPI000901E3E8|nr:PREDICTED: eukaryotic translation initiation factor 4G-like [Ipomoea nil]
MYQRQHRGKKKNEPRTQYNWVPSRPGGSAQLQYKRVSSGKGGGGTGLPPPSLSSSSAAASPSLVYRIVKKAGGEGSQSSLPGGSVESVSGYVQSDAPVSETSGAPTFIKPINTYEQEDVEIASKAQSSQSASGISDTGTPTTPVKDNTSKGASVKFGSFGPGFENGTQVPARTNSAPPDLNEQKRNKAWLGSSKGVEYFPITASRQPQPWEVNVQTKDPEPKPRPRKDIHSQISAAPYLCTMQNSSFIPHPEVSVTMPYQQPHVPMQGGFPGPQLQHQQQHPRMPFSSYQMPMQLPGGDNNQVWQPPFIPGLQPRPLPPPQGMMHQGPPVLNFPPRHDYKPRAQFGGVGVGASPQFVGKPTAPRVKITHPETHEELILGGEKVDAKLDGGAVRMPSYHSRDSQPQPFYYGPSHARPSFSHMHPNPFKQTPSSAMLKNSQMPQDLPILEQKSSGMCSIAVSPNRELIPGLSADRSNGDFLGPMSANSSDVKTLMRTMQPNPKKAESQIHSKFSTKQPTFVPRSSVQSSMIPSHDAAFIEKNIGVRRERAVQGVDKSSKTAPVHSEQSQHLLQVGSQSEEPELARGAISSANAGIYVVSAANEAPQCNVVINTNNKALKTAKRDDYSPPDIPAEIIKASSKHSKANGVEQCSLDNREDIHGSRERNSLASGSPEIRCQPLNLSEVLLSDTESKQPMSGQSLNPSSPTSPFKAKGKAFEEVNLDLSPGSNPNRAKSAFSRRREKRKEIIKKADGDHLCMSCKSPKKKLESPDSSVSLQVSSSGSFDEDQDYRSKTETDYWKNEAGISTQKLETSMVFHHKVKHPEGKKRYSPDFLITLSSNYTNLPTDFKLASDVENLLCSNAISPKLAKHSPKGTSPSNAQHVSRTAGGTSRLEYRAISVTDNVRRTKSQATFASGPEPCNGANRSGNNNGIRPGQRGNYDVGRNLRVHAPMGQRSSRNGNKWQRASRSGKGSNPQSPLHRAQKKYEVRKVNDVEEGKQRQLKAILNKLTPQNFERLFQQVKEVTIDNAATLAGVISQIFDKALMEPTFCEMYVDLCYHLSSELPDFVEDDQRITFKRLLLNKCQEEFERGEREQAEAEKMEGDGVKQSDQEREEKRIQARRRMLGNIRLIGELYKNKMLTERIMHECIQKLLGDYQNPDEEDIEALCKLMCTIGEMIDHAKAKDQMDTYFEILSNLANNTDLSSRLRFMLMDVIDLRKNNWQQRRKVEGPKKLEELHRDAHQERQAHQTNRFTRAPNSIPSPRRGHPSDIDNHATTMLSTSQISAVHGMPSHIHGFGGQDVRLEDKHLHEGQASSFPLPHTSISDNTIYLDPWGISASGPLMLSCSPPTDINSGFGETIIIQGGPGGYSSVSELLPYNIRQEPISRYGMESFVRPSVYDHSIQQGNVLYASRDAANLNCSFGRSSELSSTCLQTHPFAPNPITEKVLPEERLAELSISAIREFYSAVDENEVVLCIRELNSPSFIPTLISLWVSDSFERKDRDRILLSRLLVNLTKSRGIMDSGQLISGFESVLATLEDAITDAPKAAAFLGSMFGTMIIENVVSLEKIGNLLRESIKKPGHLQIGLAHEVLENTFAMIRSVKGESFLREICLISNIELEDFAPRNLPSQLVSQSG